MLNSHTLAQGTKHRIQTYIHTAQHPHGDSPHSPTLKQVIPKQVVHNALDSQACGLFSGLEVCTDHGSQILHFSGAASPSCEAAVTVTVLHYRGQVVVLPFFHFTDEKVGA